MNPLIDISPEVMLGKPVIRRTRITVELILQKLSSGATIEELLEAHPRLSERGIQAAIEFGKERTSKPKNWSQGAPGLHKEVWQGVGVSDLGAIEKLRRCQIRSHRGTLQIEDPSHRRCVAALYEGVCAIFGVATPRDHLMQTHVFTSGIRVPVAWNCHIYQ
jgi:uncharacterized protein (DUF433 family)